MMLKCYLALMNEFDNEDLVSAFESIMTTFQDDIKPYAVDICSHLQQQYIRCIQQDADEDDGESILTAVASFTSIRRIIDVIQGDVPLMTQIEAIVYPCLLHSLTADGLDSIEEGIDCITLILYHGYKERSLSAEMWKLYPQLLYVCAGGDGDEEGGFGFEFVNQICVALKNYVARDPQGMMQVGEGQSKTHIALIYHFFKRCLAVTRNGNDYLDGVAVVSIIVAMFENMHSLLDNDVPLLLSLLIEELAHQSTLSDPSKMYQSMILQAISMSFTYHSELIFNWLETNNHTLTVFQAWFSFMNDFKKDFELRRIIFGLSAIIKTNEASLPGIVNQKLPDIMNQLTLLAKKMHTTRLDVLKSNETLFKNGGEFSDVDSDEEALDDDADTGDLVAAADSDEQWEEEERMFARVGAKLNTGKKLTQDEMNDMGIPEDEDDESDEDYEYNGGDMNLYDSRIDDVDELRTLKESLQHISETNQQLYSRLQSGITDQEQIQQFVSILDGVDGLIGQEKIVRGQLDELEKNRKKEEAKQ